MPLLQPSLSFCRQCNALTIVQSKTLSHCNTKTKNANRWNYKESTKQKIVQHFSLFLPYFKSFRLRSIFRLDGDERTSESDSFAVVLESSSKSEQQESRDDFLVRHS